MNRTGTRSSLGHRAFAIGDMHGLDVLSPGRVVEPGAEVFAQGAHAEHVFYLQSGLVKLLRVQADGGETIVGLRSSGWFLGASAALLGRPYVSRAVTLSRCRVIQIESTQFRRRVREDEELSWKLHEMHSHEAYEQMMRSADLGCLSARGRLEQFLHDLGPVLGAKGGDVRLAIPL